MMIRTSVGLFHVIAVSFPLFVGYLPEIPVHSDKILISNFTSITHISDSFFKVSVAS